jgi:hypothetical protein
MVKQLTVFSDRAFRWVTIAVITAAALILIINIFLIGGDTFVFSFNSAINAPLAIVITIAALSTMKRMGAQQTGRLLWAGILIGWALWALAEVIYGLYSILGQEAPYPSIADIFWMVGYLPMGLGLYLRSRTLPIRPTRDQWLTIAAFSILTILLAGVFVFWPTFQSFDPSTPFMNLINIAYPVEDCLLLIVVWRLFFTYEKGEYAFGWRLLAVGFILLTIGDLIYLYANSTDPVLYYPDLRANFISRFGADLPYSFSYLSWVLGIFALRIPTREERAAEPPLAVKLPQKYAHILIFTKYDNSVIDVSPNFSRLLERQPAKGRSLAELLGISAPAGAYINDQLKLEKKITDLPVEIEKSAVGKVQAWLCGIAVFNPQGSYSGSNLLLSIPVDSEAYNELLNPEKRLMAERLLDVTGSQYRECIDPFLVSYYTPFFKGLHGMAAAQGGEKMSAAFQEELGRCAEANGWDIRFHPETGLIVGNCAGEGLKKALPALLESARKFTALVTDQGSVDGEVEKIKGRFGEEVRREMGKIGNWGSGNRE